MIIHASFDTGNLGVSALAWSAINLLHRKWPGSDVSLLKGRSRSKVPVIFKDISMEIPFWPIRYSPKLFMANHIIWMLLAVSLIKFFPIFKKLLVKKGSTLEAIYRADVFADIAGGDSFSDIYGMQRFIIGYLTKRLCQLTGKPFIMLPQTYGPFKSPVVRLLARRVLKRATRIYSRDKAGMAVVKGLIGETDKLALSPDMAFVLESKVPKQAAIGNEQLAMSSDTQNLDFASLNNHFLTELIFGEKESQVIGLNVSGLLYNGGYTGKNEFGIKCEYKNLVERIVRYFIGLPETNVLLVPHVVSEGVNVEDDLIACHQVRDGLSDDIREKVFIAEPGMEQPSFDQCEIKYIIGKCDFFMGCRMHATIAAISQFVPTVGLAYSKKFAGVYDTVEIADCVVDLREMDNGQVLDRVKVLYGKSEDIKQRLEKNIPAAKQKVFKIFDNL